MGRHTNAQHSTGSESEQGMDASKMNACKHGFAARYFPCLLEKGSVEWQECIDLGIRRHEQHSNVLRSGCSRQVDEKMVRYHPAINRQILQAIAELERSQVKRRSQAEAE